MGENMSEVNITYETLFELLRREKNRDELQKLDENFFSDLAAYLKGKEEVLEEQKKKQDLFVVEEKEKAEKQLENIKKILKEFYERREKKLLVMALDTSKVPSIAIDSSVMLKEERMFYDNVLGVLNTFREGVLHNLQHAKMPEIKEIKAETAEEAPKIEEKPEDLLKSIKFTHDVPKFIGIDLKEYGPFEEGNVIELPPKIVDVLINKGRAEEN
jgi:DNA replication factor GINS